MNDKYDTVKPGEEETKFQFYDHNTNGTLKLSELQVDSEYVILHNHKGKQLFFDDVRGMLSVDEKLRHSTSQDKKFVMFGRIVSKIEEDIKINIRAKTKTNTYNRHNYVTLESSGREFTMTKLCQDDSTNTLRCPSQKHCQKPGQPECILQSEHVFLVKA